MSDQPSNLPPLLPQLGETTDGAVFVTERAKRVYAVIRYSGNIALIEMRDGYESALRVAAEGPGRFYPTDEEWAALNTVHVTAIDYVENGATP